MRARGSLLVGLLALAGCSSAPAPPQLSPPPPQTPLDRSQEEAQSRKRARVHTELAGGYYELRNMSVALDEIKLALNSDPDYGPAYNVAGLIYAALREERLAQENFQRALRINPLDSDANNNYGQYLCDRRREAEALKYFHAALANPLYATPERAYVNAGLCTRRQGDVPTAQDYFLRALRARPTQPQALYQLADIAYSRKAYEDAKNYLVRLEQVARPTAEMLWLALRVERNLGDRNAEAAFGQQLRRQFPDSKEAKALLAGLDE